jgi:CobQ-like glutamine amidotransferase family enzyme
MAVLNLVHLYPTILNLYGDRGNITTLSRRCAWRGHELRAHELNLDESFPDVDVDLVFIGGDQDREQAVVAVDLRRNHGARLEALVQAGVPVLAVCGGYQLLQKYYRPAEGPDLVGLGIFDAYTHHPGHEVARRVGNIVVSWEQGTIVGFENHGGRTFLGSDAEPLGTVLRGFGNNGKDGTEGARVANAIGTYVHGSLLPKNPELADYILGLAFGRRFPEVVLERLDDSLERQAHEVALVRAEERL